MITRIKVNHLPLSNRAKNYLYRNGIFWLDEINQLNVEELFSMSDIEKNTLKEIIEMERLHNDNAIKNSRWNQDIENTYILQNLTILQRIYNVEVCPDDVKFINDKGFPVKINEFCLDGLSKKTLNILTKVNITNISELLLLKEKDFYEIEKMGEQSQFEILHFLKTYTRLKSKNDKNKNNLSKIIDKVTSKFKNTMLEYDLENFKRVLIQEIGDTYKDFDEKNVNEYIEKSSLLFSYLEVGIYQLIERKQPITKKNIESYTKIAFISNEKIMKCMWKLTQNKKIMINHGYYELYKLTFEEHMLSSYNQMEKQIVLYRASGMTLEEVGNKIGTTKENIRQLEIKRLRPRPRLIEDNFISIFEEYDWDKESLKNILNLGQISFYYLEMTHRKGTKNVLEILDNMECEDWIRKKVTEYNNKNYIFCYGEVIYKSRYALLSFVLKYYCKNESTLEELINIYNNFLICNGLCEGNYRYFKKILSNIVEESDCILWESRKKFRYCNIYKFKIEILMKEMDLNQYCNKEISTNVLFRQYPDIMDEYDIRDEYELHNLIKKRVDEIKTEINLLKAPNLVIGEGDRDMQVLDMLIKEAPISINDLAEKYEIQYGVSQKRVRDTYFKGIKEYLYNGIYYFGREDLQKGNNVSLNKNIRGEDKHSIEDLRKDEKQNLIEDIREEEKKYLIRNLRKEVYTITYVKKILIQFFGQNSFKEINTKFYNNLGFRVNGNIIYINKYNSADSFFRHMFLDNMEIDLSGESKEIIQNTSCYNIAIQLQKKYQIVEYERYKFINIRKLENAGVRKVEMIDFNNESIKFANNQFFNIHSLHMNGFKHSLFELGFENCFYESIISASKKVKRRRIDGSFIYKESIEPITFGDLLSNIVKKVKKITVYDLIDLFNENYGIKVKKSRLIMESKEEGLFYNQIMGKIYINYDKYFEEV